MYWPAVHSRKRYIASLACSFPDMRRSFRRFRADPHMRPL
jgi:hypothetical protein